MEYTYYHFKDPNGIDNARIELTKTDIITMTATGKLTPFEIENRILKHFPELEEPEPMEVLGSYYDANGAHDLIS